MSLSENGFPLFRDMRCQEGAAVTIPQTNFDPPFNITRASHLVFTARDLAASRDFYVEVLGLIVSDENADTIWLRGVEERCHHSLTLKRTLGQPQCERIGFRVFTEDDLERAKAHFDRAGIPAAFTAPSCCYLESRSSTSTTSRCAARSARRRTRICGACRRRAPGSRRPPHSPASRSGVRRSRARR